MKKRPKVELAPIDADSDTKRILEQSIKALKKQGFEIIRERNEIKK